MMIEKMLDRLEDGNTCFMCLKFSVLMLLKEGGFTMDTINLSSKLTEGDGL